MGGRNPEGLYRQWPAAQRLLLTRVLAVADRRSIPIYLVGGAVRDRLLRRKPKDLDLAVEGDAAGLARDVAAAHGLRVQVHGRFGTASLQDSCGESLDLASTRKEVYPAPAQLPVVSAGTLLEDLARRDFTVNALALRLSSSGSGRFIDPHGGRKDLRHGIVRVLHRDSFQDDPTRAFRAARLAVATGFSLDPSTGRWLAAAISSGALDRLSAARLGNEFGKLVEEPALTPLLRWLQRRGLLAAIHPALAADARRYRSASRLQEDLHEWPAVERRVPVLVMLLSGRPARACKATLDRLQLAGGQRQRILHLLAQSARLLRALAAGRGEVPIRMLCLEIGPRAGALSRALVPDAGSRQRLEQYLEANKRMHFPITGRDLLEAGLAAGPEIHQRLQRTLRAYLQGRVRGRAATLKHALSLSL